uniref:probable dolichyl pyrophosphate Glc1Man9GlcNAc2 alpha-1,3-glucosyltransferase isoform X1 n=2 Tax=Styela clava TaxID=7725 RepID=UPI00193A59E0|nr:probable dolichyl pyrophosphate Glc1Man9GlcNAc2 alpha-1,3-glucosyltransferase isoform X1 [Styela clava]
MTIYVVICAVLISLLKLLFLSSYRSTDFEVHRNWLAITNNPSHHKWYYENTSEWTLDYPPFFAWFEWSLSQAAKYFDEQMLVITNLKYDSDATILFQKLSVIFADFLLIYATYRCSTVLPTSKEHSGKTLQAKYEPKILSILIIFNAGLLLVDHIHFQYNGFLTGMLFLSMYNILDGNILWGSFWFATLLNFKHIYLYMAPAYGIYLFRIYCMDPKKRGISSILSFHPLRLLQLAATVILVFSASFVPFKDHLPQVISRLFPFKRGLTHAYWAPNFWALYIFLDKILSIAGVKFKFIHLSQLKATSFSKGLVEEAEHAILPSPTPLITVIITLVFIMPCLIDLWFWPKALTSKHLGNQFIRSVVFTSLTSFMFGWHVHEKAILMAILPLTLLSVCGTKKDAEIFVFLQAVGHYSLFPLLFMPFETVTKISIVVIYTMLSFELLHKLKQSNLKDKSKWCLPLLGRFETLYIFGLVINEVYCSALHRFMPFSEKFEFVPLMMTSTFCAVGVTWSWIKLGYSIFVDRSGYPIE